MQRYSYYCSGLGVTLRAVLSQGERTLEQELDLLSERAKSDGRAATQLMALGYYLRDIIDACSRKLVGHDVRATNYHSLVQRLDRCAREQQECVLYVNYDTLLDSACAQETPVSLTSLEAYTSFDRLKLFKLYGSVNWEHHIQYDIVPNMNDRDYVIRNAIHLSVPPEIELRNDWAGGVRGQEWIPALAIPIESKREFECPPAHIEELERLLPA